MENTTTQNKGTNKWIVLSVLVLAFASSFLSRFVWGPLMVQAAPDLGINMLQAGNLMSGFYFGYLITQIPGGYLADKFKVKWLLFGTVALVALSTLLMSFVTSYSAAYAIRAFGGLVSGSSVAFCSRIIADKFEPKQRGLAFGILFAAVSFGSLISSLIAPASATIGWRGVFQLCAGIIAVVALLIIVLIKEPARVATDANHEATEKVSFFAGLKNYFTNKQILIISLAGFLYMALPTGYVTWANKFMQGAAPGGLGLSIPQANVIVMIYSICSIIGSISSGFIAKKFSINPKTFAAVIYLMMAASILAFGFQQSYTGLIVTSIIFGFVSNMAATHVTSWAVNVGGNKYAATTTSIQNLIFQSSNVIFPLVVGAMIDANTVGGVVQSFNGVWILYAGLVLGAFITICFGSKKSAIEAMK